MNDRQIVARDIMVTQLVTLRPEMDVFAAIDLLLKHRISGAPVVDELGNYLGVFSERSSISLLVSAVYDGAPTNEIRGFIMRDVPTISPDVDLLTIAQMFLNTNTRRLPVLDEEGHLIGQISRRDVLRAAQELARYVPVKETTLLYLSGMIERENAPIT